MTTPERRLTEGEVSAVFRRAAELDQEGGSELTALDRTAIERVAVEAGLSVEAVRRALAELDAGTLTPERRPRAWQWPGGTVTVERRLPLDAAVARKRLSSFLRSQTLRVVRDRGGVTVWELAEGVAANVARGVNPRGRIRLKRVDRVTLAVTPNVADDEHRASCTVRIEIDFRRSRRDTLIGASVGTGIGALTASGGIAASVVATNLALFAVPVGSAMAALVWFGSRAEFGKQQERAVAAVELALDQLEAEA